MKHKLIPFFCLAFSMQLSAQGTTGQHTHADSLRGTLNPDRTWWNVLAYDLTVQPDFDTKTISGKTTIFFKALGTGKQLQIDLQQPLIVDSIITEQTEYTKQSSVKKIQRHSFTRNDNIAIVQLQEQVAKGKLSAITVYYHGKPREAVRPPWDGGWIWKKDAKGRPWMSVACQGLGASVWYPCKDHQSDEPENGASLTMIVPDTLVAVGNGRLQQKSIAGGLATYTWAVTNPINNYNIIPYIGYYVTWGEKYTGEKGNLDLDYWVLDYDLEKAKHQFKQVIPMLKCFEYWFGPYPFYEDGYKLVESPHLGMEHQSAVAYGNGFQNGYRGTDLSGSGWGKKWDFIIIHESGHEWFGNNITTNDIADMWVHEGFTNYSETIYTTCQSGIDAGNEYNYGTRKNISNDIPIIGPYGVNKEGSGDMYYKGGNLLNTIRHIIDDDEKFRMILRGLNKTFYHQTVTSKQVEAYISKQAGIDLSKVFDQYLRTTQIPQLQYYFSADNSTLHYKWASCIEGFNMPVVLHNGTVTKTLRPTTEWKQVAITAAEAALVSGGYIEKNFYITLKQQQ